MFNATQTGRTYRSGRKNKAQNRRKKRRGTANRHTDQVEIIE